MLDNPLWSSLVAAPGWRTPSPGARGPTAGQGPVPVGVPGLSPRDPAAPRIDPLLAERSRALVLSPTSRAVQAFVASPPQTPAAWGPAASRLTSRLNAAWPLLGAAPGLALTNALWSLRSMLPGPFGLASADRAVAALRRTVDGMLGECDFDPPRGAVEPLQETLSGHGVATEPRLVERAGRVAPELAITPVADAPAEGLSRLAHELKGRGIGLVARPAEGAVGGFDLDARIVFLDERSARTGKPSAELLLGLANLNRALKAQAGPHPNLGEGRLVSGTPGGLGAGLPDTVGLINVVDPKGPGALAPDALEAQLRGAKAGLAAIAEGLDIALAGLDEKLAQAVEHGGMRGGRIPGVVLRGAGGVKLEATLHGADARALWRGVLDADAKSRPASLRAFLLHMRGEVAAMRAEAERLAP